MNSVTLIGNLGQDPELKHLPGGQTVCEIRMATSESWKDKEGKKQERTEWHSVIFWGNQAETVAKYFTKGKKIAVTGRIETRTWDDKEGKKHYKTEIRADRFEFVESAGRGGGDDRQSSGGDPGPSDSGRGGGGGGGGGNDGIPF